MAVLHKHLQHLLHLFIFPESRVRFLRLLSQAGLWSELDNGQSESTEVGFWSYVNGLGSGEDRGQKVFHVNEGRSRKPNS